MIIDYKMVLWVIFVIGSINNNQILLKNTILILEKPTMENNRSIFSRFVEGLNEFYHAPYRQSLARAAREEEDLFMLLLFSESLGIENPASFYTFELQPLFLERFHQWHLRMGMPRCPLQHAGCC